MDPSNGKASNFERRSSVRRSLRLSTAHGATDDDDYDLSAMMVADGFRPTDHAASTSMAPQTSQPQPDNYAPSTPTSQAPQLPPIGALQQLPSDLNASPAQKSDMRARPSSISKPPRSHDSLALRNDGASASTPSHAHVARVSSMSSDSPVMRVESPYRGPSGPSHPYQMYPQRTMSVATTSTTAAAAAAIIPEDRSYTGPRGPTHPYALYPQNTVPTGEPAADPIPLGFNGMGGNYQRQIGPDGEEAGDMIGPLGHMEELPPYTRYAENAFVPKTTGDTVTTSDAASSAGAVAAVATVTTDTTPTTEPTSPNRSIAGAGGIGIATRDPEFSSTEDDIGMPRTRPSVRSHLSEVSQHNVNTAARGIAEKPTDGKWKLWAKKKLWDIVPYWAICLLGVGLILMGIIMGAVIGTLLTRHKKPPYEDDGSSSASAGIQTFSAVPTGMAKISTGHYGLPPFDVSQSPDTCFNDTSQSAAWSCDIKFSYYSMDVTVNPKAHDIQAYQLVMTAKNATNAEFLWGPQAPSINEPITLSLVNDTYELGRGPAWWATMTYNKTVLVPEDKLHTVSKRGWDAEDDDDDDDGEHFPPPGFKKKGDIAAQNGDKPWVCTWPGVQLGIFIYPSQNTSSSSFASTTAHTSATATTSGAHSTSTSGSGFNNAPVSYPKALKMVEQRYWTKDNSATCRQIEIIDNGKACRPLKDADGNPIEVSLVESDSLDNSKFHPNRRYHQVPKRWHVRDMLRRGSGFELTECGCLWWST
ncbi:hypothetical protein G7Z17_g6842 [Cylindrodendrum hubeiense]|uniref:DUF7820 domain-containing protein n=1 Tax=Cylindrodendrum hubeiense TaxID=595255 RepID=A0A9P5H9G5_9HYPO|nr:hypothetical protein G7Z17_g6842 [Cylindrodendrum hubeiense]